jgi:NDP-sugar pyrophosphorylase family protein
VWLGEGCELGEGVRLLGPVAIGDGCRIGAGSSLRHSIVLPGAALSEHSILIGAITGHADIPANLRPLDQLSAA